MLWNDREWTTERTRTTTKSAFIICKKIQPHFYTLHISVLLQGLNHVFKFTFSLRAPKPFSSPSQNKWIGNHSADKLIQFTGTWTTHNFNICNVFGNNGKNLYALEQTLKFYPRERWRETYGIHKVSD